MHPISEEKTFSLKAVEITVFSNTVVAYGPKWVIMFRPIVFLPYISSVWARLLNAKV